MLIWLKKVGHFKTKYQKQFEALNLLQILIKMKKIINEKNTKNFETIYKTREK